MDWDPANAGGAIIGVAGVDGPQRAEVLVARLPPLRYEWAVRYFHPDQIFVQLLRYFLLCEVQLVEEPDEASVEFLGVAAVRVRAQDRES